VSVEDGNEDGSTPGTQTFNLTVNPVNEAPVLKLHAYDKGNYLDSFNATAYSNSNGATPWTSSWQESADQSSGVTGGQIRINNNQLQLRDRGDGASIQRAVNLAGATSATLSYNFNENGFDSNEQVRVYFDNDTTDLIAPTLLQTITSVSNGGNSSFALSGPLTANAAIRFEVSSGNSSSNDYVYLDNVRIDFTKPVAVPTTNYGATFTEDGPAVAIASGPGIAHDTTMLQSAKVVLTNARARDVLAVGHCPQASSQTSTPRPLA
jgi:hypothetical protein